MYVKGVADAKSSYFILFKIHHCANQLINGSEKLLSKFNHLSVFNRYISQSLDQDLHDSIHVFSSFFYTKLSTRVQIGEIFVLPRQLIVFFALRFKHLKQCHLWSCKK